MTTLRQARTEGGVVIGNKYAGQEEHMANRDRAMCSNTTQTKDTLNNNKKTYRTVGGHP